MAGPNLPRMYPRSYQYSRFVISHSPIIIWKQIPIKLGLPHIIYLIGLLLTNGKQINYKLVLGVGQYLLLEVN